MGMDLTAFDSALKQYYTNDRIENMVYEDRPLLAMMKKREDFAGRNMPVVLVYGNPQGRSASFARAQSRAGSTSAKVEDFLLTRVKDYAVAIIDNETLLASESDMGAFLEAATVEVDGAISSLTNSQAAALYRAGYGSIGTIGSISSATLTLANIDDVVNFEIGMELDVAATEAGALRAYGTSANGLLITGVNRNTGVITFGYNVTDATNGIPAAAANDYIFVRGDHTASTITKLAGLEAWVPSSDPSSTAFYSVDRSVDVTRLGGLRYDASAVPIEEALIEAASKVGREGGKLDHFFMNFAKFSSLEKALGSKVQYIDMKVGEVGFRGITINGPKGPIQVVPDQFCQSNRIWGLNLSVWSLATLGKHTRTIDTDGLQMLRQASADGVECRMGYYGNVACRAPGWNINVQC